MLNYTYHTLSRQPSYEDRDRASERQKYKNFIPSDNIYTGILFSPCGNIIFNNFCSGEPFVNVDQGLVLSQYLIWEGLKRCNTNKLFQVPGHPDSFHCRYHVQVHRFHNFLFKKTRSLSLFSVSFYMSNKHAWAFW